MAVAYAPFDEQAPVRPPRVLNKEKLVMPVSDNTECNFVALGFIVGIFVLGLVDSMRST
jgi:hypothetical protein